MTTEQYNELLEELNFEDRSVGIYQMTLEDTENIEELLRAFNYTPIGYYETRNSRGFKFKDENDVYAIQESNGKLQVFKLMEI